MSQFTVQPNSNSDRLMILSIGHILSSDYQTPLKVAHKNQTCIRSFESRVTYLLGLITESKLAKLGNNPPDFEGNQDAVIQANNAQGRLLFNGLSDLCSEKNSMGQKSPYPFVSSLALLLKEYGSVTETYVDKTRMEKVDGYKVAQENNRAEQQERKLADSRAKIKENEVNEKTQRDREFQDAFNQKEKARRTECLASSTYARFTAASRVQENLARVKYAKESIKKEQEIGATSGYDNASNLNELGRAQVFAQDNANDAYKDYRKSGGTAISAANVVAGKNPCL